MATILLVDDEPDIRFLARVLLELAGHVVQEASHGQQALGSIADDRPDAVLTDRNMPVMDGVELIRQLRANPGTQHLPILMVSANPSLDIGVPVLRKPFTPQEFSDAVEILLTQEQQ